MPIRVALVEDVQEIRDSMSLLINGSDGFTCPFKYIDAESALADIPQREVDVVLMDIHLPGIDGISCIEKLKPLCPKVQFMICTSFEDSESVFKALKAGATGYLTKTTQPSKLLDAIQDLYNGGSPMSSHIARKVVLSFNNLEGKNELQKLSSREQTILELLSKGLRYKEIADKLFISTETVRTHVRNIYDKLQVNSRTDALNKVYPK